LRARFAAAAPSMACTFSDAKTPAAIATSTHATLSRSRRRPAGELMEMSPLLHDRRSKCLASEAGNAPEDRNSFSARAFRRRLRGGCRTICAGHGSERNTRVSEGGTRAGRAGQEPQIHAQKTMKSSVAFRDTRAIAGP
jgi:hypothetical protein